LNILTGFIEGQQQALSISLIVLKKLRQRDFISNDFFLGVSGVVAKKDFGGATIDRILKLGS